VLSVEDWAEIRRLRRSEQMPIAQIARVTVCCSAGRTASLLTPTRSPGGLRSSPRRPGCRRSTCTTSGTAATAGRDAKIDWKALSKRIGHADVAFTMKQYVQTDLEADRQVANTLAELIIGGSLASTTVHYGRLVSKSVSKPHAEGPFSVRERASGLGSGGGI